MKTKRVLTIDPTSLTPHPLRLTTTTVAVALLVVLCLRGVPAIANHESSKQPPLWTALDEAERLATIEVPEGMVLVPAGWFLMGSDPNKDRAAGPQEQPQHQVYLDAFQIDRYE